MKCIALVIGIDNYVHTDIWPTLRSAVKDANDIKHKLEELKFEVVVPLDDSNEKTWEAWNLFTEKLVVGKYNVGLVYFAGHGVMANRSDCLLLKDAVAVNPNTGLLPPGQAFKVQEIMTEMNQMGDQINILILDACRKDAGMRGSGNSATSTLSNIPYQTFIAYSTSPGDGAIDGNETHNSPFATSLLSHIMDLNLPIEVLFKKVRKDIKDWGLRQMPWDYSCLVDNYSFNHGQLSKYYDVTYREDSFKYIKYSADSESGTDLISYLWQDKETANEEALKMIASSWKEMSKDDLFVAGRMVCNQAVCGSKSCMAFLADTNRQRLFNNKESNHLLNGYYYELYFDENDEVRTEILGDSNLTTTMQQLCMLIKNAKAEKFIKDMLVDYEHFYYVAGSTNEIPVHIESEYLDYTDTDGCQLKYISSIQIFGDDVIGEIDWEDEMLEEVELRNRIIEGLSPPRQLVRMKLPQEDVTFVRYKLTNLAYDLQECMADYCPDEVSILSSHSYVEDVDGICITKITSTGSGIIVEGSCTVDVHMEYDHEDMGNMAFPCTFETEMEENKDGNYRIDADTCKYKVDTDEFYK